MNTSKLIALSTVLLTTGLWTQAASNVDPANQYAYGANLGWISWYADAGVNGAVVGEFVCSNYLYSANCGWIHLGDGTPTNGVQYTNAGANDFGVNHLGDGRLRGFAYGANIGWLNFEPTGNPRVDLNTGNLYGDVYSANCGWISLSNAFAKVRITNLAPPVDSDGDTIADSWELQYAPDLTVLGGVGHDQDGDGKTDRFEYTADTNPADPADYLRITVYTANSASSTSVVTWTSKLTRLYGLDTRTNLVSGAWTNTLLDAGTGIVNPDGGPTTTRTAAHAVSSNRFFQVRAFKPLTP